MRIGIDARYVQDHFPGIGRYTYNLVRGLAEIDREDTFVVFHNPSLVNTRYNIVALSSANVELREVDIDTFSLKEQLVLPLLIKGARIDVFHSPYYLKPYLGLFPSVVTIHDTVSSRYPQYLPSVKARLLFHLTMRLAIRSSKMVIADSQSAKEDLVCFFHAAPSKIRAIPLAADEFYGEGSHAPPPPSDLAPYILYVGINKPHKNLVRLIQAYAKADTSHRLVIAGWEDPRFSEPRRAVAELGLEERVTFLGGVNEMELLALYRGADLFVFSSLAEGFGLPVLEAMACGLPVIASNIPPLAELVGDAGLLIDPFDVDALAEAMTKVLSDPALRADLASRGKNKAKLFSWRRTAAETLAVYREVAKGL